MAVVLKNDGFRPLSGRKASTNRERNIGWWCWWWWWCRAPKKVNDYPFFRVLTRGPKTKEEGFPMKPRARGSNPSNHPSKPPTKGCLIVGV